MLTLIKFQNYEAKTEDIDIVGVISVWREWDQAIKQDRSPGEPSINNPTLQCVFLSAPLIYHKVINIKCKLM